MKTGCCRVVRGPFFATKFKNFGAKKKHVLVERNKKYEIHKKGLQIFYFFFLRFFKGKLPDYSKISN